MADVVRTEVNDGVLTITLDRPKANAIDVPTSGLLYAAFERLQEDAAAIAEDAGDAAGRVELARLGQDVLDHVGAGVDGATGVEQAYKHGAS